MHKRRKFFPVLLIFFVVSIILFFLSQQSWLINLTGFFETILKPVQLASYSIIHVEDKSVISKLKNEIRELRIDHVKIKSLEQDNRALRDQFALSNPEPKKLLPSYIVSIPAFIPGTSIVDTIIIDKGSSDKIKTGQKVIYKDNYIGKVVKTSSRLSVVNLQNNKDTSFTAQTNDTSAVGILTGTGIKNSVLKNVLLSDILKKGDTVIAKDLPILVVGKIISVNKKASSLFQSAEVESMVDVTKLKIVFVLLEN